MKGQYAMNKHIGSMKDALTDYLKTTKSYLEKIDENNRIYQPAEAEKANAAIYDKMRTAYEAVIEKINNAKEAGRTDIEAWGQLDGSAITPDVELLKNDAVRPDAFRHLVEKYQNNSTMLQLLANYAEKKNGESGGGFNSVWKYPRPDGTVPNGKAEYYDTSGLPSAEKMQKEIDKYAASALNLADRISDTDHGGSYGTGPNSPIVQSSVETFGADT